MPMAKRFTATEKWEDRWFRSLKPTYKLLWTYLLDRCDMAGVIEFDLDLAEVYIGAKIDLQEFEIQFKNRVFKINGAKAWIPKFIEFQYGCTVQELDPHKPLHIGVLKSVTKYKLTEFFSFLSSPNDSLSIPYGGSIHTPQVEVKEGVGVEVKDKNPIRKEFFIDPATNAAFEEWIVYRKEKRKPVTPSQLKKQIEFLKMQSNPVECINRSIRNGWIGLFEEKQNGTINRQPQPGSVQARATYSHKPEDEKRFRELQESLEQRDRERNQRP